MKSLPLILFNNIVVDEIPMEMDCSADTKPKDDTASSLTHRLLSINDGLECSICCSYLQNPMLTKCGHRFCQSCIYKWLQTSQTCPTDNEPLNRETDLFLDNYTKREVENLPQTCENEGCSARIPLSKMAEHYETCKYKKYQPPKTECPYKFLGCNFQASSSCELLLHEKNECLKHLQLLSEETKRISEDFENCRSQCVQDDTCSKGEQGETLNGKLLYVNDVYQKLVELDQRSREFTIRINKINSTIEKLCWEMNYAKLSTRETSNGLFVWEITNLDKIKNQMIADPNFSIYSSPFSSSDHGYRFQLRLTSSSLNPDGLKLLIHVVKGIYDPILKWPFYGKVVFRIINQVNPCEKLEAVIDGKSSVAFQRAKADINVVGYGLPVTMTLCDLEKRGFVCDSKIIVVVTVKSHNESDFVIDLSSEIDQITLRRDRKFNNSL